MENNSSNNNAFRNTIIGAIVALSASIFGSWVNLTNRITALETQVKIDRQMYERTQAQLDQISDKLSDVQNKVTELSTKLEQDGLVKNYNR